jgi:hypothetical protein
MSIGDFLDDLQKRTVKFISHHVDMKWQIRDWRYVKQYFPRGTWCCVQDFSENYTIEVALENQSKYYNNVSITLFGIIAYFWIDDWRDSFANQSKREDMKRACAAKGTPPILTCALVLFPTTYGTTKLLCNLQMILRMITLRRT